MATERLTPERRRELTRNALLDAAETVFAQRGFEAAALDDIGEAAGFTKGAIYSNFGNRQQLFLAVMERHNQRLFDAYARLLDDAKEHRPGATAIAKVWAEYELANRGMLTLALEFRLRALRDKEVAKAFAEFESRTEQLITRFVADRLADAHASIDIPVEDFAAIVYAANQGLWQHAATCGTKHPRLFETFLELLIQGANRDPDTVKEK